MVNGNRLWVTSIAFALCDFYILVACSKYDNIICYSSHVLGFSLTVFVFIFENS